MIDLLIVLIMAHLLGDFVFQTLKIVKMKQKISGQIIHSSIIFFSSLAFIPTLQGLYIALIMGFSHLIIDLGKLKINKDKSLSIFLIDQIFHFFVIILLVSYFGKEFEIFQFLQYRLILLKVMIISIGVILNCHVSNWIITKFFQTYYPNEIIEEGLRNAGKFIGYMERIIIMIMVLTSNIAGIGFLFTAKSILRIGKLTDSKNKKEAEYIILGTFLSFVLALVWSYFVHYLFNNL